MLKAKRKTRKSQKVSNWPEKDFLIFSSQHRLALTNFKRITMKSARFLNHSTLLTMVWQVKWVVVFRKRKQITKDIFTCGGS